MKKKQKKKLIPNSIAKDIGPTRMLTTEQLARRWNMSAGTLRNWRNNNKGPMYLKIEGTTLVRYPLKYIERYENAPGADEIDTVED